jgi:hypothetical protein
MNIDDFNKGFRQRGYSVLGKTVDEILSHDDPELSGHIFDAICQRIIDKDRRLLTDTERKLREVYKLCGAVGNSGFDLYFSDSYSDGDAEVALAGLKEMGAEDLAAVLEHAMGLFPGGKPSKDNSKHEPLLDQLSQESRDVLDDCSMRFSDLDNVDLAIAYAKKKKADIVLSWP